MGSIFTNVHRIRPYLLLLGIAFGVILLTLAQWVWPIFHFDRTLINTHEWWRLLSAHFVHTNGWHAVMNLSAFVVICALFPKEARSHSTAVSLIVMSLLTSAGLYVFYPNLHHYVGLSGILHGLLVSLALQRFRHERVFCGLLLASVALKIMHEQYAPESTLETAQRIGARVAIESHFIGACSGVCFSALHTAFTRLTRKYS